LNLECGPWITGGAPRKLWEGNNWQPGDIDIFFADENQRKTWTKAFEFQLTWVDHSHELPVALFDLSRQTYPYVVRFHMTENALTYHYYPSETSSGIPIQLVQSRMGPNIESVWSSFDLAICEFATDGKEIWASDAGVKDLENRRVTEINHHMRHVSLPLRLMKYLSYGFDLTADQLKYVSDHILTHGDTLCDNAY
jgi:hypothetical protein